MASNTEKRITAKMILDSSGYNNSLRCVNAETQKYQAQMKVASEGIKAFGKDSEKLKSVQESLSKQIEQHSKKVDIYKQSLEKTTSKMQDNVKERDRLKESLTKTESELKKFIDSSSKEVQTYAKNREELTKLNKQYDESKKRYGENSKETQKLRDEITKLENEQKKLIDSSEKECKAYEKTKGEVEKLENEYKKKEKAVESNAKQVQSYETNLNKANAQMAKTQGELKKITEELDKQNNKWIQSSEKLEKHSKSIKDTGKGITEFGKDVSKLSIPIAAVGIAAGKSAIDFESAFTGVKKTVEGTDEQFAQLSKGIRNMSLEMPPAATEIAGVAEAAGQLGIKTENIEGFTKSMVMLGDSTNMKSDEAATALARLANITQMPQDQFDKLGSVIVHLGNNLATTESEIVEMGLRLAGAGKQVGLTEAQTLGLAGAFSSVGIEAEMGGSAISKVMVRMQASATIGSEQAKKLSKATGMSMRELELLASNNGKAFKEVASSLNMTTAEMNSVIKSSKDLDNFGKIAGMTGQQFKEAFQKDATTAIISFIRGLGNAENAGTSAIEMLEEMGIKEVRLRDSLLRAANAGTLLEDSVNMGTKAWGENSALVNEANQRYETTESKLKMAKNQIVDAGITIGNNLLPVVRDAAVKVADLTKRFSELSPKTQQTIMKVAGFVAVTGPAIVGIGKLTTGIGSIIGLAGKISGGIGKFKLAMKGAEAAATGIGAATGVASKGIGAMGSASAVAGGASGIGALAGGLGTLASAALPVVAVVGGIAATIYAVHESNKLMGESCIKSAEDMGFMERAIASTNGTVFHTNAQLEEMNIKCREWSKDVSPEVQKSLEDCSKRIADYSFEVDNATQLDEVIDDETGAKLNTKLDNICNSAIEKIKQRSPETQKEMAEAFKADDGKLDENEQKLLEFFNKSGEEQIKRINDLKKKITDIQRNAKDKNVAITKEEKEEIARLTQEIGNIELQNTANSKQELLAAQADFNARMKNLDMKGVSDLLATKAKSRDEEIGKIKLNYDKQIEMLKLNRKDMNEEQQKACDEEIAKLEEKKQQGIKKEEEKYKGYLDTAKEEYPNLVTFIDQKNGEMLTNQQKQKFLELGEYGSKMEGMLGITKTGYYKIKNSVTGSMHDCYVEVDSATGQINGVWDDSNKKIYGNPIKAKEEIDQELKNGVAFQPIKDSYDEKKEAIYKNAIEVDVKKRTGLFDWVKTAWNGILSFISSNPANIATTGSVGRNYTGTNYFKGGLTYLHDQPGTNNNYELYDLPRGTRIFNHDASQDLVMKTAEDVASKVANGVLAKFNNIGNSNSEPILIQVPVILEGREIARASAKYMNQELAYDNRRW